MAKKIPAKKTLKAVKPAAKKPAQKVTTSKNLGSKPVGRKGVANPSGKSSPAKKLVAKSSAKSTTHSKSTSKIAPKSISNSSKKAPVAKISSRKKVTTSSSKKMTAAGKGKAKTTTFGNGALRQQFVTRPAFKANLKLTPFLAKQRQRLLQLKDTLLDSMSGVARGNLHSGSETSAFGMHQADAGSDAYDRDFAMSILSQEQNSLYEIDEALKRIEDSTYGQCEICNKPIPHARLEARPFTRTTVDCQEQLEKRQHHHNARLPINSLVGLTEEETEGDEEEATETT